MSKTKHIDNIAVAKLRSLYNEVFDENGNVRSCGRDKCKELIIETEGVFGGRFGNQETGFMDVKKIKKYLSAL